MQQKSEKMSKYGITVVCRVFECSSSSRKFRLLKSVKMWKPWHCHTAKMKRMNHNKNQQSLYLR